MAQFLISAFADEAASDLNGQIAALKRNGIRCIEPRNIGGGILKKSEEQLEEIAAQLKENGITVPSLGSPIGKYPIDDDFEVHLAEFRHALRACQILGAKNMRIFSFFVPQERLEECREEVFRRMKVLLELAEEAGVTLCHENESKIYGQNPKEVADLLTNLPGLRGIFDAANYVRQGYDPMAGFGATKGSLEYIHIKDAIAENRAHVPAGMGDGHYEDILKLVDEMTDKTITLTVEPHLFDFAIYKAIDAQKMDTALTFENSDQSFDCAVSSIKKLLTKIGFTEGEDKIWRK